MENIKNKIINLFICLICILSASSLKSQNCTGCSTLISQTDTLEYVVSIGQTLCIDQNGNLLGKVTLNGGTICNSGFFNPTQFVLTSGAINNFGNMSIGYSLTFPVNVNVSIYSSSVLNIKGNFTQNGATVINSGYINVSGIIIFNSGSFNNNNVVNCDQLNGNSITNSGIININ